MNTLENLKQSIIENANNKVIVAQKDYEQAINDCKNGIYDKWFRYNRTDDGQAYDCGWVFQNQTTQNEKITFLS